MRVLITGMSGFVGQNLSTYLSNMGVDSFGVSLRSENWQSELTNGAEAIIHLAGKAHDLSKTNDPNSYFLVNRDLTIKVFDLFIKSDIKDFFFFSSVKAVADSIDGELFEEVDGAPLTPYGKSKLEAESYLRSQSLPNGKRLFIIRPCMIHGPGNKGNLNLLYSFVKKGIPWFLGEYENKRSFLGIDNLCYLTYCMLQNKDVSSGIYNFADDEAISTNKLVEIISTSLEKKCYIIKTPKWIVESLAKAGDLVGLPLNSERLRKLTESFVVSNNKIKRELNIEHLPKDTQAGIVSTIKSF